MVAPAATVPYASPADTARDGTLDLLRFIGAVFIIQFHLDLPFSRFTVAALPFFTLLLVYFGAGRSIRNRAQRLLVPWAFWSLVYAAARLLDVLLSSDTFFDVFRPWMLLTGPSWHLWFLPFTFGFLAVMTYLPKSWRMPLLIVTTAGAIAAGTGLGLGVPLSQWLSVWPAAALGYAMAMSKTPLRVCLAGVATFAAIQVVRDDIHLLRCLIAASAVAFAFLVQWPSTPWLRQLARLSFGVYLVHPLVISCLVRISDFSTPLGPFLLFGATVAASVAVTVMLRRTPLVRYL